MCIYCRHVLFSFPPVSNLCFPTCALCRSVKTSYSFIILSCFSHLGPAQVSPPVDSNHGLSTLNCTYIYTYIRQQRLSCMVIYRSWNIETDTLQSKISIWSYSLQNNWVSFKWRCPEIFPTTKFPIPNFPQQIFRHQIFRKKISNTKFSDNYIFRQLHFSTITFIDGKIFRLTNFSKSWYIF